jgi:hypothetical protein
MSRDRDLDRFSGSLLVGALPTLSPDDDLDSILTEMSNAGTAAAATRRNRGVGGTGRGNGLEDSRPVPTPESWRANREGTSQFEIDSTMYGQPETVNSVQDVDSVAFVRGKRSIPTKKYKVFKVPDYGEGFEESCFSLIGQGTTFCTARRCQTAHQGGSVCDAVPGDLYVLKGGTTGFADPKTSIQKLSPELLVSWNSKANSLEEWSRLFMLVEDSVEHGPASAAILEAKETFADRAEAHRTPGKRKAVSVESPYALRMSPYRRQLMERQPADEEDPFSLDSEEALEILRKLDDGLEKTTSALLVFTSEYEEAAKDEHLGLRALEYKLDKLSQDLGSKPRALTADIDAPTAWGSIGALASKLDNLGKDQSGIESRTRAALDKVSTPLKDFVVETLAQHTMAVDERMNKIKRFAVKSTQQLNARIDSEAFDSPERNHKPEDKPTDSDKPEWVSDVIKSFETRLDDCSVRISRITAKTDEEAVKFAGLGFRSPREANAWLAMHLPEYNCGLIVDVNIVMEHVHAIIGCQPIIGNLEKFYKLKIETLSDGLAMTSFETQIPRYFCKPMAYSVVKNDGSYFDEIVSNEEWQTPGDGFRDKLKEELSLFKSSHQGNIDLALERDSPAYSIASMALTESVAWVEGFIVFVDDYQRDLTRAKFGTKKAWHVTTRLGRRMLSELSVPRNGAKNSFKAGKNQQVCERVFWAVLKSHDVMARYRRHGYKNDPSISSELVKFLAVNTGFEAIDVLTTKVASMEQTLKEVEKEVKVASKAASTASNKVDESKKLIDLLSKRIAKLEK